MGKVCNRYAKVGKGNIQERIEETITWCEHIGFDALDQLSWHEINDNTPLENYDIKGKPVYVKR